MPSRGRERLASGSSSSGSSSARNSTSSAADSGGSSFQASGVPGMFQAAAISVGATISSVALAPAATSAGTALGRRVDVGELDQRRAVWRGCGSVSKHRLGDERERPLGADHQAPEDLQRLLGVEERAQAVAGRVLDRELTPACAPHSSLVGAQLVADLSSPRRARARRRRIGLSAPCAAVSITAPLASTNVIELTVL